MVAAALLGGSAAIASLACTQASSVPPSNRALEDTPTSTATPIGTSSQAMPETGLTARPQPVEDLAISASELSLGGIYPGDDEATVIARLGQPETIVEDFGDRTFEYTDLTVFFYEGRVIEVTSANSAYCTPSGICPNMAFERARAQYGTPTVADREDGQYMEYYPSEPGTCWLKIAVDGNDAIDAITVECQL
ncbi:hypothetical protein IQ254_06040 [Nodosilinea sp. LEGE 07088]|uniref:hypothetical protein n=1 Tax=Nodosilinea sp. LEGE 07088 TaxID=2777968 RepID=UPI00187F44DA|nr:hypothetical protein [Nodosilinea sp. LEGE 07088]MBE9136767.1 hypothetical protein [Nodosilinea sp. LEGE 07088]